MGLLSAREYAVAALAIAAIMLWIFGGTLADGLNRTGFVTWFAETAAGSMAGLSPNQTIIGFVCVYFLSHYMFASLTAMLPILLTLGLAMRGVKGSHSCSGSIRGSWAC